jgi:hypothetical protein
VLAGWQWRVCIDTAAMLSTAFTAQDYGTHVKKPIHEHLLDMLPRDWAEWEDAPWYGRQRLALLEVSSNRYTQSNCRTHVIARYGISVTNLLCDLLRIKESGFRRKANVEHTSWGPNTGVSVTNILCDPFLKKREWL